MRQSVHLMNIICCHADYLNQKYSKADLKEKAEMLQQLRNLSNNTDLRFVSIGDPALDIYLYL